MKVSQNEGSLLRGPHIKDCSISGSRIYTGVPSFVATAIDFPDLGFKVRVYRKFLKPIPCMVVSISRGNL